MSNVVLLESDIEKKVVLHAKKTGWLPFKLNLQGNRGWPDRLFIYPGPFFVFIEFKAKGKKPTELQEHRMAQLRNMGIVALWYDDAQEAMDTLDEAAATEIDDDD